MGLIVPVILPNSDLTSAIVDRENISPSITIPIPKVNGVTRHSGVEYDTTVVPVWPVIIVLEELSLSIGRNPDIVIFTISGDIGVPVSIRFTGDTSETTT